MLLPCAQRTARSFLPRSCSRLQVQTVPSPGHAGAPRPVVTPSRVGLGSALSLVFSFQGAHADYSTTAPRGARQGREGCSIKRIAVFVSRHKFALGLLVGYVLRQLFKLFAVLGK